jgi:hypothetical protein
MGKSFWERFHGSEEYVAEPVEHALGNLPPNEEAKLLLMESTMSDYGDFVKTAHGHVFNA